MTFQVNFNYSQFLFCLFVCLTQMAFVRTKDKNVFETIAFTGVTVFFFFFLFFSVQLGFH